MSCAGTPDKGGPVRDLDALPDDALVFGPEVARLLAISLATFHERRRYREFPIAEVLPRLDRRPRFRLGDVRAYVRGEYRPRGGRRLGGSR
jgi:hypothetical protein